MDTIREAKTIPIPTPDPARDMVDSPAPRNLAPCNKITKIFNLRGGVEAQEKRKMKMKLDEIKIKQNNNSFCYFDK